MTSTPSTRETCLLVAEITGDNPLLDKIGAVETQRAVERCRNRAERSVKTCQGVTLKTEGRRVLASFARAENAVQAAFDMRTQVKQLPPVSGVALSVHVVIHAGGSGAEGQPEDAVVATASQLIAATPANQILISSEAACRLADATRSQLVAEPASAIAIPGYSAAIYAFPAGVTPVLGGSKPMPPVETFMPTATSLSLNQSPDAATPSQLPAFQAAAPAPQKTSLMLRHNKNNLSVSDHHPVVLAGREEGNDLVIADRRASRHHSRIEWRHNHFVLIDTSTNGTFMVDDAGNEVVLRRGEADLPARGRIGFGYSPQEPGAEVVFFDIGHR